MSTAKLLVPAAQYLRMSTEHQQYSTENQSSAIQRYAENHGFTVVRTYSDPARSGLVLKNRRGLRDLLQDVTGSNTDYKAILVYDVSRWGRFQTCTRIHNAQPRRYGSQFRTASHLAGR